MSAGLSPSMSSIQFDTSPASSMVGKMRSVDTSFQEGPAPAAQHQFAAVNPYSAQTNTTRGAATAWRNPQAGAATFINWDSDSGSIPGPQPIGA